MGTGIAVFLRAIHSQNSNWRAGPNRLTDLAQPGLRAMLGGLLACYLTATFVGSLL
jgi:nucleoside permease NupC